MKTLIWKELRENFKPAVIGFGLFAFAMFQWYHRASEYFASIAGQLQPNSSMTSLQPLLDIPAPLAAFCAIFGAVLGWMQIHHDRHRDLWAFLVHRPVSRTKIFLSKVIAGLCLYAAGAGLPLLGMIAMVRAPGHIPAPFEWGMALPVTASFCSGMVGYFAGLLTGLRQARWYVSRGLGLGVAIVVAGTVAETPEFWLAMIAILVGGAIVGTAAWGSFLTNGYYEGQPRLGQRALATVLMLGCCVVVLLGESLIESQFPSASQPILSRSEYRMARDGTIYKLIQVGKMWHITTLDGAPIKDPKTGQTETLADFHEPWALQYFINPDFEKPTLYQRLHRDRYSDMDRYFSQWGQSSPDTLWYWSRNGRLWAYDIASRRFIGSLGPNGFAPGRATGPDRFNRPQFQCGKITTDTAVYQLNLENRTATVFFAATNNELIGGAREIAINYLASAYNWFDLNNTLVVTKGFIHLVSADGKLVCQTTYFPAYPAYDRVGVSYLEDTNRFALSFYANVETNRLMGWTLPTRVVWLAAGQGELSSTNLPSGSGHLDQEPPPMIDTLASLVMPPAFFVFPAYVQGLVPFHVIPWQDIMNGMSTAVFCAGIGWLLGRRNHFLVGDQLKWAGFHLVFSLPGLLAFLCLQEWPAREPCPGCNQPRVVNRDECEHCGAAFAQPPRNGTEIFESIGKA